jgi:hypothetical protein
MDTSNDLQWFLYHLNLDGEDQRLEDRKIVIDFYWDTVDVSQAILGMAACYKPEGIFDYDYFKSDTALVHSLIGAGWLGKIRLLQPHQAEFLRLIDTHFGIASGSPPTGGPRQFVRDARLRASTEFDLDKLPDTSDEEIAELVQTQAGNAPTLFKIVHAVRHNWKSRLAGWVNTGLLELDTHPPDYTAIVSSPEFDKLKSRFDKERQFFPVNNFADAMALCLLGQQVKAFVTSKSDHIPRFFASAGSLYRRVLKETNLEYMLEYEYSNKTFSALRDADYYKLRASFHPPGWLQNMAALHKEFYELLRDARDKVAEILEAKDKLADLGLAKIAVGGRALDAVVKDLRQYWFLENVWLPYAAATDITEAVRNYVEEARQLKDSQEFKSGIERAISQTRAVLNRNSEEYKWMHTLWAELEKKTQDLMLGTRDQKLPPLDIKTSGLLRFGFPLHFQAQLEKLLEGLTSGSADKVKEILASTLRRGQLVRRGKASLGDIVLLVAVSWVLGMYKYLIEMLSRNSQHHFSLKMVAAASRIQLRRNLHEAWSMIKSLERQFSQTKDIQKCFDLAVGLAYLYSNYRDSKMELSRDESEALEQSAITLAKRAYVEFQSNDAQKVVYSLNQYLYYMVKNGNVEYLPEMDHAAEKLLDFMSDPDLWQYRYDDTLAWYFFWRGTISKQDPSKWLDKSESLMEQAWKNARGDLIVAKHRNLLQIAIGKLQRVEN